MASNMEARPRDGSRDSLDYYWQEIKDIEKETVDEQPDEELPKTPDEGEEEAAWLEEAGYGHLLTSYQAGKELEDEIIKQETSSLTHKQAEAVRKRVDTLNATLRKKQKQQQQTRTDVRDIFNNPPENERKLSSGSYSAESAHPARPVSSTGKSAISLKTRGGYSMTGVLDQTDGENAATSVETLSVQMRPQVSPRAGRRKHDRVHVPPIIADEEVTLSFIEDTATEERSSEKTIKGDNLPNFVLVGDKLGCTRIDHLGKSDRARIKALALIELTALFDVYNIRYTRRKAKKKLKEHGLFGVALQTLLDSDQKKRPKLRVPLVFNEIIKYLQSKAVHEEGILRVPGSALRIKALRQELEEKLYSGIFSWDEVYPNDVAALLKQFLRELPAPLLTFEHLDAFAQVESIPVKSKQVQALNLLVLLLPDVHRDTLMMLLEFLGNVVHHKSHNRMNVNNVSMIMAPNLFMVQSAQNRSKAMTTKEQAITLAMATETSSIVRMMIKYQDILFTVPSFMISQIRRQHEVEQLKRSRDKIKKYFGKRDKGELYRKPAINNEADFKEGVIRVQGPHLPKSGTAVKLDAKTTAADVVTQLCLGVEPSQQHTQFTNGRRGSGDHLAESSDENLSWCLYEVGGNIAERCLDSRTNMLELYKVNPNAEWVVRVKSSS